MSNTQLEELLADQPEDIQDEIVRINTDARTRALQVALLVPVLAALIGLANSFRMVRIPEPRPRRPRKVSRWADPQGARHAGRHRGRSRDRRARQVRSWRATRNHDGSASGTFVDPPAVAQPIQEQETPAASGAVGRLTPSGNSNPDGASMTT